MDLNSAAQSQYITFTQAAKLCPGKRPHKSTIWRWATEGFPTPAGERIHLEHFYVGRRAVTTADAVKAFIQAMTAVKASHFNSPERQRMTRREHRAAIGKEHEQASQYLASVGI